MLQGFMKNKRYLADLMVQKIKKQKLWWHCNERKIKMGGGMMKRTYGLQCRWFGDR